MTELPLSHLPVPLILGPRTLVHLQRQWEAGMRTRESARAAELKLAAAAPRSAAVSGGGRMGMGERERAAMPPVE